jgi:hypothetical protein
MGWSGEEKNTARHKATAKELEDKIYLYSVFYTSGDLTAYRPGILNK